MAVIGSVLAFSPETNTRHLVQTALINVLGIVLAMEARGRARWFAVAGLVVMWGGMNLPPGNKFGSQAAVAFWHGVGGPTWCVLLACGLFLWSTLLWAKAPQRVEDPVVTGGAGLDQPAGLAS